MEKQPSQTNESVKTGLEIESNKPDAATETAQEINKELDEDELVHEVKEEQPDPAAEHDIDELVHEQTPVAPVNTNEEIDVDDIMHEPDPGEQDVR